MCLCSIRPRSSNFYSITVLPSIEDFVNKHHMTNPELQFQSKATGEVQLVTLVKAPVEVIAVPVLTTSPLFLLPPKKETTVVK